MNKTLITRITNLKQYNPTSQTVLWKDDKINRWLRVYPLLKENDNVIFITPDTLLIGTIKTLTARKSILCVSIKELPCSNDQFLQLNEIYPELISRVKGSFKPFVHSQTINIRKLSSDINNNRFISFYLFARMDAYNQKTADLKTNDRVVIVNDNGTLNNVKKHTDTGLVDFSSNPSVSISVQGFTFNEILEKNKSIRRKSVKSNNVNRIEQIKTALDSKGYYKFKTFFAYHDALYNKRVYGQLRLDEKLETIKIHTGRTVYKVSMGPNDIKEDPFTYFSERSLLVVHSETKAMGTSGKLQGDTFSQDMKVGDYFYLCRGNSNMEIIGKITGEAVECEYDDYEGEGWLQREYKIVAEAIREDPYNGDRKWWTPNARSTCIAIPKHELSDANTKLFVPFFNRRFEYEEGQSEQSNKSYHMNHPLNQILYGPPGTGKTYKTINKALSIVGVNTQGMSRAEVKKEFDKRVEAKQIVFTTFHQSMSYEDFIEGIKPMEPKKEGDNIIYKVDPGIFKRLVTEATKTEREQIKIATVDEDLTEEMFTDFYRQFVDTLSDLKSDQSNCKLRTREGYEFKLFKNTSGSISVRAGEEKANLSVTANELIKVHFHNKEPTYKPYETIIIKKILEDRGLNTVETDNGNKSYVLIIDEINRGNVSQIFGELITLIEEDKRLGREESLQIVLPYSKQKFGIPSNVYIIGTMNTADRSVEALDTALRRRFSFEEVLPEPILISKEGQLKDANGILEGIDLVLLLTTINNRIEKLLDRDHQIGHSYFLSIKKVEDLKSTFQYKIIPLLQEYFFGDFGKIGLVIGKLFFEVMEDEDDNMFADFEYDDSRLVTKKVYRLKNAREMPDKEFIDALKLLMKMK